ncbi:hypothetical protein BGZ54_001365, partial [Gamsiella multidivaricata]
KEDRKTVEGRRVEHVSFSSFIKNFELTLDKAQQGLDASSAAPAKKVAILAQEASLHESAKSFGALKKENASTTALLTASGTSSAKTVPIDNVATDGEEQYEDANKQPYESDTDTAAEEPRIALSPSSKTHPFHPLISCVQNSQHVVLLSSIPNDLSGILWEVYSAALKGLDQPGSVVAKKDVLLVWQEILHFQEDFARISPSTIEHELGRLSDYQSIKALQEDLLKTLHPATTNTSSTNNRGKPQLQSHKRRVWTLLSEAEKETAKYTILQIVSQVLLWIELGLFASPTSEHVFLSSWCALFNTLLIDTSVHAVPGELVSKASAQVRQKAESKYGSTSSTACGRKVDMSVRIRFNDMWQHKVAIFGFKAATAARAVCEKQQKRSFRLNAAILYDLEAKGLDISKSYPIIAEGQALGLDLYALRRYDEVLSAGHSTTKGISLLSHVDQFKAFFESETIFILLAFKEHLRQYAYDVMDVLANSVPTPFGYDHDYDDEGDEENAPTLDPPPRPSTHRPGSVARVLSRFFRRPRRTSSVHMPKDPLAAGTRTTTEASVQATDSNCQDLDWQISEGWRSKSEHKAGKYFIAD